MAGARTWLTWTAAAVIVTVLNLVLLALTADLAVTGGEGGIALQALAALAYLTTAVVGALILSCHPRHPIGWVFGLGGMGMAVGAFASEYAQYAVFMSTVALPGARVVAWFGNALWWAAFGATLTFLFLLFPDGRLPSRRWRPVVAVATVNLAAVTAGHAFTPGLLDGEFAIVVNPFGVDIPIFKALRSIGWLLVTLNLLAAVAGLANRLRRARGELRQQLKWLAYSASICALALPAWALTESPDHAVPVVVQIVEGLAFVGVPFSVGIGILRHRLYDIDVVINRTLVLSALAAVITAVYGLVVAGVGALVTVTNQMPLSLLATAVVAVAFEPLRRRLQTIANRLVYGQRLTPYETITRFSQQMSRLLAADVLPEMAKAAAMAVGGDSTRARLFLPRGMAKEATWPPASTSAFDSTVPVVHQGRAIGDISVSKRRGDTMTDRDTELLTDLATQAGPVLRNIALTEELRASLEELRASRQRIVAAQDEQRRRVERDLHDGAQQTLVSTSAKLGLAKRLLLEDPVRSQLLLDDVGTGISDAVDQLRDLARGVFPPILTQRGLSAALEMHLIKADLTAELIADGPDGARFPPEVEAALYFCAIEALQNTCKHAPGARVGIRVHVHDHGIELEVADDGPGFDRSEVTVGSGLENMADRIDAIGGRLLIESSHGTGTRVCASVEARPELPTLVECAPEAPRLQSARTAVEGWPDGGAGLPVPP